MRSKSRSSRGDPAAGRAAPVVNTRSRRGLRLYRAAGRQLQAASCKLPGIDLLSSFPVHRPGQLEASIAAALDLRPGLLIAGGGDSTLTLAARHMAYRDEALGVLPLDITNRPITGDASTDRTCGPATSSRCFCRYHLW